MPSWWGRNSEHKCHHHNNNASITRNSNKKERPNSFDGAFLVERNSPRISQDFTVSSPSVSGSSAIWGFDLHREGGRRREYPLPLPQSQSLPLRSSEPSVVGFSFESLLGSCSTSSGSSSSHSDGSASDHGQFSSFRIHEETGSHSWSRTSHPGSGASTTCPSPYYPKFWCMSFESPRGHHENGRHPSYPLPLPPGSPTKPSECLRLKWKKGRLLGRGTFGHVYAGFNSENGQMCAIKEVTVISDDHMSKDCLKQLNQEISLLSQLSHPNIVQYYGSELGRYKFSVYLEFVSGGSIHKLLQEYGPFTECVIQSYTRQILSGLVYLHGRNTVHRDIKGANVLVDPNGEIKLADFGMAKHMTSSSMMLSFKGSPYWMAPEVIMNATGNSFAVDIWSLGCTVLEMATSKPPWSCYEGVAAIFKIANSKELPEIPNYMSDDAKSFVKLCLQRNPSVRPTAAQLLHHPFVQDQNDKKSCNA